MIVEKFQLFADLIKSDQNTDELCSAFVLDLKTGVISFLELTKHLEDLLTNSDITLRRGGNEILSTILSELPLNYLSSKEIELLVNFYCDRVLDHHSITPAVLKGFLALLKMVNLPPGTSPKIFTVLNLHYVNQSQVQPDRLLCYELFDTMITKQPKELQALGPDFVCGYLTVIDSERDPRNLMYLFNNLPNFFRSFPPGHLMEDAFESVSCYFPIDFRSNPNDPRGISRDDLSQALLPCLTAIDEFLPFAVSLALEKLSSDLQLAKSDSLSVLKECFINSSSDNLCIHISGIVSAVLEEMKLEIITEVFFDKAIDVFIHIIQYLENQKKNEDLVEILDKLYSGVFHYLHDIQPDVFLRAVHFLTQLSRAAQISCRFIVSKAIPQVLSIKCHGSKQIKKQLQSLGAILSSCIIYDLHCADITNLQDSWKNVLELFSMFCECNDSELKITAIEGYTSVVKLLDTENRHSFYEILSKNILESESDISLICMKCCKQIAQIYPQEMHNIITNDFDILAVNNDLHRRRIFQSYCVLAAIPEFLIHLDKAVKHYMNAESSEYAGFIIESLKNTVVAEKSNDHFLRTLHNKINLVEHLMNWWHEGCNALSDDLIKVYDDEQTAKNLHYILCNIIRVLDKESQLEIARRHFQFILDYSKRFMNSFTYLNMNDDFDTPKVYCSLSIITFESVVTGLLPEVLEENLKNCLPQVVRYLLTVTIYCSRGLCCSVASRSMATIFNKLPQNPDLENEWQNVFSYVRTVLSEKCASLKINALNLFLHIFKALLRRGYADLIVYCDQLVELLKQNDIGDKVAAGFQLILSEDEYFLNTSYHCTVRLFHRQRLFSCMIPRFVDLHQNSDQFVKRRCAVSTLHLLQDVPQPVLEKYFKKIVPLLLELLEMNYDATSMCEVLQKLLEVLDSNPSMFETYLETFIPKLLSLSRFAPHMNVRTTALKCLYNYGKLNAIVLLPFKTRVLQDLAYCLDDKKRLVRKEAAKTRTRWFIIGTS